MRRGRLTSIGAAVVLVLVTGGAVFATRDEGARRDPVAAAVDAIPRSAPSVDVTVWSRIDGPSGDVALRDVTTRSVIFGVGDELEELVGWGPRDLAWESFAPAAEGGVVVLSLDTVSPERVAAGWNRIATRTGNLTWSTEGADVSGELAATFSRVRLLKDRRLLVAGSPEAVDAAVATIEGRDDSVLDDRSAADVVRSVGDAASVFLRARGVACTADPLDDASAAALRQVEATSGALVDPRWIARALTDSDPQRLAFVASFASPQQARAQLTAREALTRGSFIGRTGVVADSLVDLDASVSGSVTRLGFALTDQAESFMSDTGPVVFAGCPVAAS